MRDNFNVQFLNKAIKVCRLLKLGLVKSCLIVAAKSV